MNSAGGINPFTSRLVIEILRSRRIDTHITKTLIPSYHKRCNIIVCTTFQQYEPNRIRITNIPYGGYFIWIQLVPILDIFHFLNFCHTKQTKEQIILELNHTIIHTKNED